MIAGRRPQLSLLLQSYIPRVRSGLQYSVVLTYFQLCSCSDAFDFPEAGRLALRFAHKGRILHSEWPAHPSDPINLRGRAWVMEACSAIETLEDRQAQEPTSHAPARLSVLSDPESRRRVYAANPHAGTIGSCNSTAVHIFSIVCQDTGSHHGLSAFPARHLRRSCLQQPRHSHRTCSSFLLSSETQNVLVFIAEEPPPAWQSEEYLLLRLAIDQATSRYNNVVTTVSCFCAGRSPLQGLAAVNRRWSPALAVPACTA